MSSDHEQDDAALLEELARLVEQLRTNSYEQVIRQVQGTSPAPVEEFSDLLSRHLLYEEEILFPALREPSPAGAGMELDALKREHEMLRGFARSLVGLVRQGEVAGACDTGRMFMAALLDHIGRETKVTRKILAGLSPAKASRLKKLLDSEHHSVA